VGFSLQCVHTSSFIKEGAVLGLHELIKLYRYNAFLSSVDGFVGIHLSFREQTFVYSFPEIETLIKILVILRCRKNTCIKLNGLSMLCTANNKSISQMNMKLR
jgi:hypothetical protein